MQYSLFRQRQVCLQWCFIGDIDGAVTAISKASKIRHLPARSLNAESAVAAETAEKILDEFQKQARISTWCKQKNTSADDTTLLVFTVTFSDTAPLFYETSVHCCRPTFIAVYIANQHCHIRPPSWTDTRSST